MQLCGGTDVGGPPDVCDGSAFKEKVEAGHFDPSLDFFYGSTWDGAKLFKKDSLWFNVLVSMFVVQ